MELNLPEHLKHFETILANQSIYREMYRLQQKNLLKEKLNQKVKLNYYGDSSQYRKLWRQKGALGFNK